MLNEEWIKTLSDGRKVGAQHARLLQHLRNLRYMNLLLFFLHYSSILHDIFISV